MVPERPAVAPAPVLNRLEAEAKAKNEASAKLAKMRFEMEMPNRITALTSVGTRLRTALGQPVRPGNPQTLQQTLNQIGEQTGLPVDRIIERLTADLPPAPQPGESIERITDRNAAYVRVVQGRGPIPEDQRGGAIYVNADDVRRDQEMIRSARTQCVGNVTQLAALDTLNNALQQILLTDPVSAAQQELREQAQRSVTNRGLKTMGLFGLIGIVGTYAAVTGAIGLANGNMPMEAGIAGGIVYFLANPTARRSLLAPKEQRILQEAEAFIKPFSASFDPQYQICANGTQWANVFEEWKSRPQPTTEFIRKLKRGQARDAEKNDYMSDRGVGPGNVLRESLLRMINTIRPESNGKTDLELLTTMWATVTQREARESVLNYIRTNRGRAGVVV